MTSSPGPIPRARRANSKHEIPEFAPRRDTVIVGDFLLRAVRGVLAMRGEREGDADAGLGFARLGVGGHMPDKNDFVDAPHMSWD